MRCWLLFAVALAAACQGKSTDRSAPPASSPESSPASSPESTGEASSAAASDTDPAYRADFDNLCHAEARSGADDQPGQRSVHIAMWLGDTIKTDKARSFLATLARTPPADKAALLDAERKRLGLGECPLIKAWQG